MTSSFHAELCLVSWPPSDNHLAHNVSLSFTIQSKVCHIFSGNGSRILRSKVYRRPFLARHCPSTPQPRAFWVSCRLQPWGKGEDGLPVGYWTQTRLLSHLLFSEAFWPLLICLCTQGDGYLAFASAGVHKTLLTSLDEESYAKYKRLEANAYSLSALKLYKPSVDGVASELVNALSEKTAMNGVVNLNRWCHYSRSRLALSLAATIS